MTIFEKAAKIVQHQKRKAEYDKIVKQNQIILQLNQRIEGYTTKLSQITSGWQSLSVASANAPVIPPSILSKLEVLVTDLTQNSPEETVTVWSSICDQVLTLSAELTPLVAQTWQSICSDYGTRRESFYAKRNQYMLIQNNGSLVVQCEHVIERCDNIISNVGDYPTMGASYETLRAQIQTLGTHIAALEQTVNNYSPELNAFLMRANTTVGVSLFDTLAILDELKGIDPEELRRFIVRKKK